MRVENYYSEKYRNQFHFSQPANWMNDPNGMVYYDGEYHLFYQYYPDDTIWGPMHWGHAVSKDLMHWEHLPIALFPDDLGYIFSGSAVVDWGNTSGLGEGDEPAMVAIFTHHDPVGEEAKTEDHQVQSIAYSNDRGRTWTKYADNPVLANDRPIKDFRDPKVLWDDTHEQWLMTLAAKDCVHFYSSKNLIDWTFLSEWGRDLGDRKGVWECPDFFPLQVEEEEETKWVLLLSLDTGGPQGGSATQYFIGDFDGKVFTIDEDFRNDVADGKGMWVDYGADNYAGVTWSDIPDSDNRRIFLAWMSNWAYARTVPTEKWRSAMTLPRALTLRDTAYGYRLLLAPVKEIKKVLGEATVLEAQSCSGATLLGSASKEGLYKLSLSLKKGEAQTFGIKLSNEKDEMFIVGFDGATNNLFVDRSKSGAVDFYEEFGKMHFAPIEYVSDTITLDVYVDRASVEIYIDGGRCVMTEIYFSEEPLHQVELVVPGEEALQLVSGSITTLVSIWR